MVKKAVLTLICFVVISGCALLEPSDVEVEKETAATPASVPQPEPAASQSAGAASQTETQSARVEHKDVGPDYVKRIQSHLKRTGFYSGGVDGIVGPRTQSAIRHFQSSCATLKDLITVPDPAAIRQSSVMATKVAVIKSKPETPETVRLIQLRLKDAGFDPGPVDGIHGAKTQNALLALNTGCLMLGDFSPVSTPVRTASVHHANSAAIITESPNRRLRNASSPEAVRSLQIRLRDAGFDPGPIDGILGPRTRSALQRYQGSRAEMATRSQ